MRAGMKLNFDELLFFIVGWGNHFMGQFTSHVLKMVTARACLKFVFFFLLIFDQENYLIGNILLATT